MAIRFSRKKGASRSGLLERVRRFFVERIWAIEPAGLSRVRRFGYRTSRIAYCTVRSFVSQRRSFQAAALTYYSTLSIVPFLAFSFAVVKGFGGYKKLVDEMLRPYIANVFPDNRPMQEAIERVLMFVQGTDLGTLGAVGVLTLAYSTISLLSTIEQSLNDVWGVRQSRPMLRRVTDYVTLVVITPLLVLAAGALAATAQSSALFRHVESLGLEAVLRALFRLTSVLIACGAMIALYVIMPNARIRVMSAVLGGVVSGILWQVALTLQVNSQKAVAQYNALYSTFSALPIFLFWMYLSWIIVLVGAELAANHQHEQLVRQRMRAREADQAYKEALAVEAGGRIASSFVRGCRRWTATTLAAELGAPLETTQEVLDAFVKSDLFVRVAGAGEPEFAPARELESIRVKDLLDALRHSHTRENAPKLESESQMRLGVVVRAIEDEVAGSKNNVTLRQLADMLGEPAPPPPPETQGMTAGAYREYAGQET